MAKGIDNAAGEVAAQSVRIGIPDQPLTAEETRRARLARWAWPVALAVAAIVLFLCYFRLSGTTPDNSDGSDQVLQAWDMLHGNWLLHGWTVGDVSYYTTELPEYMIVAKILGLGPGVIHVAAAFTYTLLVLLAGLLAKGRATGKEGVLRALIAAGILLAPQLGHGTRPPALAAGPPRHPGAPARHLPGARPRAAALVHTGRDRGDAHLGHHRRPGRRTRRGAPAGRGVRHPRLLGPRRAAQAALRPVVRDLARGGGHRLGRRVRARRERDPACGRVHIAPVARAALCLRGRASRTTSR